MRVCGGDGARCDALVVTGADELCNLLDDDCDGATDEDPACPALDTRINSGPAALTALTKATFVYVDPVTAANTQFECSYDGGAWFDCDGGTYTLAANVENGTYAPLSRPIFVYVKAKSLEKPEVREFVAREPVDPQPTPRGRATGADHDRHAVDAGRSHDVGEFDRAAPGQVVGDARALGHVPASDSGRALLSLSLIHI